MRIAVSLVAIATSWLLLYLNVEPVPTWFYVFAWYPTIVLLDSLATRLDGRPSALWHRSTISVLTWSAVIWLVLEAANFRLQNWYYVFLPQQMWARWSGILLSFATVVPALLYAERVLDAAGMFPLRKPDSARPRGIPVRRWELDAATILGVASGSLALFYPRLFFPLIWVAGFLIADPFVYRRDPSLSLIGDLERGAPGRIGRLMVGGLGIGLIWETYNFWARGKWIYTVPLLDGTKLFEMPPIGFVGFPVFALEAWTMYSALCVLGVATPIAGKARVKLKRLGLVAVPAITFVAITLVGMERRTISSTVPSLADLPGVTSSTIAALGDDGIRSPFTLAEQSPERLAAATSLSPLDARRAVESARLVTLRGIGTRYAQMMWRSGINSICDLSSMDAGTLTVIVRHPDAVRPTRSELRVWIRAAQRECAR